MQLPQKLPYGVVHLLAMAVRSSFGEVSFEDQKQFWKHPVSGERWEVTIRGGPSRLEREILLCRVVGQDTEVFKMAVGDLMEWDAPVSILSETNEVIRGGGDRVVVVAASAIDGGSFMICDNDSRKVKEHLNQLMSVDLDGTVTYSRYCPVTKAPMVRINPMLLESYLTMRGVEPDARQDFCMQFMWTGTDEADAPQRASSEALEVSEPGLRQEIGSPKV